MVIPLHYSGLKRSTKVKSSLWKSWAAYAFLTLFLLVPSLQASQECEEAALLPPDSEPLALALGCVNVVNGDFIQSGQEFALPSGNAFSWSYSAADRRPLSMGLGLGNASFNVLIVRKHRSCNVKLSLGEASRLKCILTWDWKKRSHTIKIRDDQLKEGYTNYADLISGRNDSPRLIRLENRGGEGCYAQKWVVTLPDGTLQHYGYRYTKSSKDFYFFVVKEELPNGNYRTYQYNRSCQLLSKIATYGSDGTLLDTITISNHSQKWGMPTEICSSNGHNTLLKTRRIKSHKPALHRILFDPEKSRVLDSMHTVGKSWAEYDYKHNENDRKNLFKVKAITQPNRKLLISYNHKGKVKSLRVSNLGESWDVEQARFSYDKDFTTVQQPGKSTSYRHINGRILEKYEPNRISHYSWDEQGQLTALWIKKPHGSLLSAATFAYDEQGNVIEKRLFGNLTGESQDPLAVAPIRRISHKLLEGKEARITRYEWESGRFNLLKREILSNGTEIHYSYKEGTNLVESKCTWADGKYQLREFYTYNNCALLTQKMIDDGSSPYPEDLTDVTYRLITRMTPIMAPNQDGHTLPGTITHAFFDSETQQEHPLQTTRFRYTQGDLLAGEEHFDADGVLRYTTSRRYNSSRQLIEETDAAGITTSYTYHTYRLASQERLGKKQLFSYDIHDNCIQETICHPTGEEEVYRHQYDAFGRKLKTINPFGHTTGWTYDSDGHEIAKKDPLGFITEKSYNTLGHLCAEIDKAGAQTQIRTTVDGKPIEILYPDGSSERFCYDLSGNLTTKWERAGSYTNYSYDYLNRPISTTTNSPEGALLRSSSCLYKGKNLISETNHLGVTTHYTYDGAGRKICTECEGRATYFFYDTMGRLFKTVMPDGAATIQLFDHKGRPVEERIEDSQGTLFSKKCYAYDAEGNRTEEKIFTEDESFSTSRTLFDSWGKAILKVDPIGNETHITYLRTDHLECTTTDPAGHQTHDSFDAMGRLIRREKFSPLGGLIARQDYTYDPMGRKTSQTDHIIEQGALGEARTIHWYYDAMGNPISQEEKERTLSYHYAYGRLETLIKPNGIKLNYTYDALGRLSELSSSDQTIHYLYHYDSADNPIQTEDLLTDLKTQKTYNIFGSCTKETLANGLTLSYARDKRERPVLITLPDQSQIAYSYTPISLRRVDRLKNGTTRYSCCYQYDLASRPTQIQLIDRCGTLHYTYDPLGRPSAIKTSQYKETLAYDKQGNVTLRHLQHGGQAEERNYRYDDLLQLTEENGPITHRYQYDSLSNRLAKDDTPYTIATDGQLLSNTQEQFTYDQNGNLIARRGLTPTDYTYDALDRLICVETPTIRALYTYDAQNRRIKKETLSKEKEECISTELFLYQGQKEIGSSDGNTLTQLRILGGGIGAEIGATVAIELADQLLCPLNDSQGNICALLDPDTGELLESYHYSAFGEQKTKETLSPWLFSGKRLDPESGLYAYGRRYYDPSLGRWTTADPMGYEAGPNLFTYALNRPLTHIDHYGCFPFSALAAKAFWAFTAHTFNRFVTSRIRDDRLRFASSIAVHLWCGSQSGPPLVDFSEPASHVETLTPEAAGESVLEGVGEALPVDSERGSLCITNGMMNTHGDAKQAAQTYLGSFQGPSRMCYNSSKGFALDLACCPLLKIGVPLPSVTAQKKAIEELLLLTPEDKFLDILCFSQGGMVVNSALKYFSEADLSRIRVITAGSGQFISQQALAGAKNYVSKWDPIPFVANPVSYLKARIFGSPHIQFLPSNRFPFDHAFTSPTYYKPIVNIMNNM